MTVTKASTRENTSGSRSPLSLDLIKAATNRRKRASLGAGTPGSPTNVASQNFVKSSTMPIQMLRARHVKGKKEASGAQNPMSSTKGGWSKETWSRVIENSSSRASDTLYRIGGTNLKLPWVVHPVAAAKDETGYRNTAAGQLHMLKGGFKMNCAKHTYAPRHRSLLGLSEMDIRPATSPRTSHPKVRKLRHTLPVEVMHTAEPLRSARHGNWKYHLAVWTMQRRATRQSADTPR